MKDKQKARIRDAEIKLSLISPAIHHTFSDKSINAYFKRISSLPVVFSDGSTKFVKVSTLKSWRRTYMKGGFDALLSKKRSDLGKSRRIDADLAADIMDMRYKYPKMPATTMRRKLIEEGYIDEVEMSDCTLQRFFKNNPLIDKDNQDIKDRRSFEAEYVNGIWQADTLYGPYVNGKRVYMQAIIDDKSRKIVAAHFYTSDSAATFQLTLKGAISSHGLCQRLFVDNGAPYRNEQLSYICGNLGIVLMHAAVRDGAAKGKIERFNRTLRIQFLSGLDEKCKQSLDALNDALASWITTYNNTVHSSIKTTPMQAYIKGVKEIKYFAGDEKALDEAFFNIVTRRVAKDSTVRVDKTLYDVPLGYIGKRIEIKYDPNNLDDIFLVKADKTLIRICKTDKVENSKCGRVKTGYVFDYAKEGER